MRMLLKNTIIALTLLSMPVQVFAQDAIPVSKGLAMVDAGPEIQPRVIFAKAELVPLPLMRVQANAQDVLLTYIDHAVWQITSPQGVTAATDYYGLPISPVP
ncbi:MAG: hypothetical protein ACRCT6_02900, partial [Notoacmeibacter sp.]